jgi:hypothetical protein
LPFFRTPDRTPAFHFEFLRVLDPRYYCLCLSFSKPSTGLVGLLVLRKLLVLRLLRERRILREFVAPGAAMHPWVAWMTTDPN